MRRLLTLATSLILILSMLAGENMVAQTRSSGSSRSSSSQSSSRSSSGSSQSSRSSSSSSQSSRSSSGSSQSSRSSSSSRSSVSSSSTRSGSSVSSSSRSSSSSSRSSSSAVQQGNKNSSNSSRSSSSSVRFSNSNSRSSSSVNSSSASSSNSNVSRSSTSTPRSSSSVSSSSSNVRSSNVTREGLSSTTGTPVTGTVVRESYRDAGGNYRYNDDVRVDNNHNMTRVAPRLREPMAWDRPGHFWGDHPHYYGYRVHSLPPHWRRISHWGVDYYYYNGIYYRSYGGAYVVCRPPFGTPLEVAIDRAILRSIRFAYYCDTYRTFTRTFDYYNVIARQNMIIAQQNARLIAQQSAYAINSNRALTAYELAEKLGLVQSYAYANSEYFYMDGVFYTISASGTYSTIVPPAGALVTSLPDDYEVIVMNGIEYYMVDNTVYRTTLFEGQPYLEVLGQMYGSLYSQYNVYR
ncbi:MAG: hypothetical protein IJT74_06105 [Bacteroidales bacterium]|nr:hypothetical protein [Bacteroidales bacterium]